MQATPAVRPSRSFPTRAIPLVRAMLILALTAILWSVTADVVMADDPPPAALNEYGVKLAQEFHELKDYRGPGGYYNLFKLGTFWLIFLCWVATTDWVSRDARKLVRKYPISYVFWNPIMFGPFLATMILCWFIPFFWLDLILLLAAYLTPLTIYILKRNNLVSPHERVLTKEHLRFVTATVLSKFGVKMEAETLSTHEKGSELRVEARAGKDDAENTVLMAHAQEEEGLVELRQLLCESLETRATAVAISSSAASTSVRVMIDGVWQSRPPMKPEEGGPIVLALKALCGLRPAERNVERPFACKLKNKTHEATMTSKAAGAGEQILIQFEFDEIPLKTLDDIGVRPKLQETLGEHLKAKKGLVFFSTIPGGGLRTTTHAAIMSCDRLMREFVAVEAPDKSYEAIENVPVRTYDTAQGESPRELLPKLFREDAQVLVIRDLPDAETVAMMNEEMQEENRLFISTMRSRDSVETVARMLQLGVPSKTLAEMLTCVVNQRLIRTLCDKCKEGYAPGEQLLKQLNLPAGRVKAFYRPPTSERTSDGKKREICEKCRGVGYYGRTGIFEVLVVGDTVRKVLMSANPSLDLLRKAARKDGMLSLQEEAVMMVARGQTSLQEVKRCLQGEK